MAAVLQRQHPETVARQEQEIRRLRDQAGMLKEDNAKQTDAARGQKRRADNLQEDIMDLEGDQQALEDVQELNVSNTIHDIRTALIDLEKWIRVQGEVPEELRPMRQRLRDLHEKLLVMQR